MKINKIKKIAIALMTMLLVGNVFASGSEEGESDSDDSGLRQFAARSPIFVGSIDEGALDADTSDTDELGAQKSSVTPFDPVRISGPLRMFITLPGSDTRPLYVLNLPFVVFNIILQELDIQSAARFASTNRANYLAVNYDLAWQKIKHEHYPHVTGVPFWWIPDLYSLFLEENEKVLNSQLSEKVLTSPAAREAVNQAAFIMSLNFTAEGFCGVTLDEDMFRLILEKCRLRWSLSNSVCNAARCFLAINSRCSSRLISFGLLDCLQSFSRYCKPVSITAARLLEAKKFNISNRPVDLLQAIRDKLYNDKVSAESREHICSTIQILLDDLDDHEFRDVEAHRALLKLYNLENDQERAPLVRDLITLGMKVDDLDALRDSAKRKSVVELKAIVPAARGLLRSGMSEREFTLILDKLWVLKADALPVSKLIQENGLFTKGMSTDNICELLTIVHDYGRKRGAICAEAKGKIKEGMNFYKVKDCLGAIKRKHP